jgi:hypothetical protein
VEKIMMPRAKGKFASHEELVEFVVRKRGMLKAKEIAKEAGVSLRTVSKIFRSSKQPFNHPLLDAIEHELAMIHATLESFASPAEAVKYLIDWHVAVSHDPKVNGGFMMVPVSLHKAARGLLNDWDRLGERDLAEVRKYMNVIRHTIDVVRSV